MLLFYRYVFYRIYSFFEKMKSTNPYNSASGIMVVCIGVTIFKLHLTILKFFFDQKLEYSDVVIPYLLLSILVYVINHILLVGNLKYLKIEDFFIQKKHPKYFDRLLILLSITLIVIWVI